MDFLKEKTLKMSLKELNDVMPLTPKPGRQAENARKLGISFREMFVRFHSQNLSNSFLVLQMKIC